MLSIAIIILGLFLIFRDKNKLSIDEKNWISKNQNTLIDVRIINDVGTFGYNGEGVFFDFIHYFSQNHNLMINPITFSHGTFTEGLSFNIGNAYTPNDILLYKDHYVIVSENDKSLLSINDLNGSKIGVMSTDLAYISYYLSNINATYTQIENKDNLNREIEIQDYLIIPLNLFLETILRNNYYINYHLSDVYQYYYLSLGDNKILSSILNKSYNTWSIEAFEESYYKNLFSTYARALNITDVEIHELTSREYNYGLVEYKPYEIMKNGQIGGLNHHILSQFSKMTNVEFKYTKYSSMTNLAKAINKNKVDIYYNRTKIDDNYQKIDSLKLNQ